MRESENLKGGDWADLFRSDHLAHGLSCPAGLCVDRGELITGNLPMLVFQLDGHKSVAGIV